MNKLLNIGFGNLINTAHILCVVTPDSAPAKRMIAHGKESDTLIDATQGRRTKSVIVTTDDRIVLSALQPDTLAGRFNGKEKKQDE